jgi:FKBP-type peptidyl-prolyl cis-trans isomerase FklB
MVTILLRKKMNLKSMVISILTACFLVSSVSYAETNKLITEKEKVSYSIGLSLGKNFSQQSLEIDLKTFAKGVDDAMKGTKPLLTDEEIRVVMSTLQQRMAAKKQEQETLVSGNNIEEGNLFLAENKKRKGVVSLPSGLQYEIIRPGTGPMPKADDTVETNYEGKLINGTVFDSSYKRGKPATFLVNGVIKGWTEALLLMKTGAKWKLYIPADLAYGSRSAGPVIGPGSTLIFDIELLEIK